MRFFSLQDMNKKFGPVNLLPKYGRSLHSVGKLKNENGVTLSFTGNNCTIPRN